MKKVTVNVRRHSISDKTTGEKDYPISQEGQELAFEEGRKIIIPCGGLSLYASPKKRAVQTAVALSHGAYAAEVERKISEDIRNGNFGAKYCLGSYIKVDHNLDSMVSRITKVPNVKEVFSSMPLDDAVNLILKEDPEAMEWAAGEVCSLIGDIAVTSTVNGNADGDELVELVSHSPKVEAAILRMMTYEYDPTRRRRMCVPDIRIEEIGGAFKETEYFSVEIEVGNGTYRLRKLCNHNKGQEVNL